MLRIMAYLHISLYFDNGNITVFIYFVVTLGVVVLNPKMSHKALVGLQADAGKIRRF